MLLLYRFNQHAQPPFAPNSTNGKPFQTNDVLKYHQRLMVRQEEAPKTKSHLVNKPIKSVAAIRLIYMNLSAEVMCVCVCGDHYMCVMVLF